jgi:SET domain-containing protein
MGLIIRSSDIHAAGCYTTTAIATDTRVVEYTGPRIPKDVADEQYADKTYTYLFGVGDGTTVIDGHGIAMFINHSCDPNCETEEDDDGRVWIRAIRDISPGEELTYDSPRTAARSFTANPPPIPSPAGIAAVPPTPRRPPSPRG